LGAPATDALQAHPLWYDEPFIVLPSSHPLSHHETMELQDLARERLVMGHRHCTCGRRQTVDKCIHSVNPKARIKEAANLNALQALVASGHGVGLISSAHADRVQQSDLMLRRLRNEDLAFQTFVLCRKDEDSRLIRKFVELAKKLSQRTG